MVAATDRQEARIVSREGYVSATLEDGTYAVRFPYDPDAVLVARDALPGTWWDAGARAWRVRRSHVKLLQGCLSRIEAVFIARDSRAAQRLELACPMLEAAQPALRQDGERWILEAPYDPRIVELARAACLKWDPRRGQRWSDAPDIDGLVALARALPELISEAEAEKIASGPTPSGASSRERRLVREGRVAVGDALPLPSGAPAIVARLGKVFRLQGGAAAKLTPELAGEDVQFAYLRLASEGDVAAQATAHLSEGEVADLRRAGGAAVDLVARGEPVSAFDQEGRGADLLWESGGNGEAPARICLDGPWIVHVTWDGCGPEKSIAAHRVAAHPQIVAAIRTLNMLRG